MVLWSLEKSVVEGALLVALVALLLQPAVVVVKEVHLGLAERTILPPRQNWAGDLDEHDEAQLLAEPSALHRVPLDRACKAAELVLRDLWTVDADTPSSEAASLVGTLSERGALTMAPRRLLLFFGMDALSRR